MIKLNKTKRLMLNLTWLEYYTHAIAKHYPDQTSSVSSIAFTAKYSMVLDLFCGLKFVSTQKLLVAK